MSLWDMNSRNVDSRDINSFAISNFIRSSIFANIFENLHPVVIGIRHKNFIVAADRDPIGQPKLPGSGSGGPKVEQKLARPVEHLDVVEHAVHNVNVA